MYSSFSPKDEIWFLRVCHHISTGTVVEETGLWTARPFDDRAFETTFHREEIRKANSGSHILMHAPCIVHILLPGHTYTNNMSYIVITPTCFDAAASSSGIQSSQPFIYCILSSTVTIIYVYVYMRRNM